MSDHAEMRLRALGENLTFKRYQWLELLEELRDDSELAQRIRARLRAERAQDITRAAELIRERTGVAWEYACRDAERAAAELEAEADTSEDPATDHGYDECPDCGDAGVKIGTDGYEPCARFLTCWSDAR